MKKRKLLPSFSVKFSLSRLPVSWINTLVSKWQKKLDLLGTIVLPNLLVLVGQIHSTVSVSFSKLGIDEKPEWKPIRQLPAKFFGVVKQWGQFISQPGASFPRSNLPTDKKARYSPTLQRGLEMAQGKLTEAEIDTCQQTINEPLFWEHIHVVLTDFRLLKLSRYIVHKKEGESRIERVVYLLPDEYTYEGYRQFLVHFIRPASPTLIMTLLQVLATGKDVPTSHQEDPSTYLKGIADQLIDFPYLAIWLGLRDLRGRLVDRKFPETQAILDRVQTWSNDITDSFDFFAFTP